MPDSSGRGPAHVDPQLPHVRPRIFQPARCYPLPKALLGILLGISGGAYDLAVTACRIRPFTWGVPRAREGNRTLDLRITSALLCRLSYPGLYALSCYFI